MNQYIVYVLMNGSKPETAYADEELAHHDCWVCNEAEKFSPDPMPYYVQKMPINMDVYEAPADPVELPSPVEA